MKSQDKYFKKRVCCASDQDELRKVTVTLVHVEVGGGFTRRTGASLVSFERM